MNKKNIALLVEYDGSNFCGFQKQPNARTIQGELELALSKFTQQEINLICAGRTDTGVHATGQVINFTTTAKRDLGSFIRGVNAILPKDIVILNSANVNDNFHARYGAVSRSYSYYLLNNPIRPTILRNKVGWYHGSLDLEIIQQGCKLLVGEHDFSCFRASQCQANSPIRHMLESTVEATNFNPNILHFRFTANSFLYHMIRNIIGSLIYLGNQKITLTQFRNLLAERNRTKAPPTFMPDGLYLTEVEYPNELFDC